MREMEIKDKILQIFWKKDGRNAYNWNELLVVKQLKDGRKYLNLENKRFEVSATVKIWK